MKKLITFLTTISICFSFTEFFAQNTIGYVHIQIQNAKNPLCKIDDSIAFKFNNAMLTLIPGEHNIKIWAPKTRLIDTTLFVKINDTSSYIFKLKYTNEYSNYVKNYSLYRQLKKQRLFISPILISASIGTALFAHNKANNYFNKALENRQEYSKAGNQTTLDESEASFKENKKNYKIYSGIEIGMYSLAGILTANYIRLIVKQHRTMLPIYKEEKLLSNITINTYPDFATKKLFFGLSMKF